MSIYAHWHPMKKNPYLLLITFFTLFSMALSCDSDENTATETWWIGSARVPCVGEAEQECYQVQYGKEPTGEWEFFYDGIAGFDEQYEAGFFYQIQLQKKVVSDPPADGSSYVYSLVKIVSKNSAP